MKAIVYSRYGSPDVLRIEEVAKPAPQDDEVLIQVRASSVNPYDWHFMRGEPYFMRLIAGPRHPKFQRLGVDVAGEVEAIGPRVTEFKPGDAVFGSARGALAEYVCTKASAIALMPPRLSFEQAGCVGVAGLTAFQALRQAGEVRGQNVLINGASGGVGTFAVQIARSCDAVVTGVCSTANVEMVRSLGADRVIDYKREDLLEEGAQYDAMIDLIGNHPFASVRRILKPRGSYVPVGGPNGGRWFGPLPQFLKAMALSIFVPQKLRAFVTKNSKQDLLALSDLLDRGKVTPVIDRTYPLRATAEAIRYLETGHARGKVVVSVA